MVEEMLAYLSTVGQQITGVKHTFTLLHNRTFPTEIFPHRYVWVIMIWSFCQNWGYIMVVTMTPTFMEKVLHFNIKDVSFLIRA